MQRILEDVNSFSVGSHESEIFTEWRMDASANDNEALDSDLNVFWGRDYDAVDRFVNFEVPLLLSNDDCETPSPSSSSACVGEQEEEICAAEILDICKRLSEAFQSDGALEHARPSSPSIQVGGANLQAREGEDREEISQADVRRTRNSLRITPPASSFVTEQLPYFENLIGDHVTLQSHATFENRRFGVTGRRYVLIVDQRPAPEDRLQAFAHLMIDLERMMITNMDKDDYVELRFRSNNLTNPFICPVVRLAQFDARVCIEMFENIIQSNSVIHVGDGSFRVDTYHIRLPRGGGLSRNQRSLQEFGKKVDKLLKQKRSILRVPEKAFTPHCAVVALMAAKIRAL